MSWLRRKLQLGQFARDSAQNHWKLNVPDLSIDQQPMILSDESTGVTLFNAMTATLRYYVELRLWVARFQQRYRPFLLSLSHCSRAVRGVWLSSRQFSSTSLETQQTISSCIRRNFLGWWLVKQLISQFLGFRERLGFALFRDQRLGRPKYLAILCLRFWHLLRRLHRSCLFWYHLPRWKVGSRSSRLFGASLWFRHCGSWLSEVPC